MSKTFAQAPKPKPLTAEIISAFERGGAGQDTQTHIPPKVGLLEPTKVETREPTKPDKPEPMRRLSIDLPESLHRRFKTACTRADKKMLAEVTDFIRRRTEELEKQ
jgi:hypothetical protein